MADEKDPKDEEKRGRKPPRKGDERPRRTRKPGTASPGGARKADAPAARPGNPEKPRRPGKLGEKPRGGGKPGGRPRHQGKPGEKPRGKGRPGEKPGGSGKPGGRPRHQGKPGEKPRGRTGERSRTGDSRSGRPKSDRQGSGRPRTDRERARADRVRTDRPRAPARPPKPRIPRPVVAVFAKAPVPGQVKTRLTPALRAQEAADLYRALLLDTLDAVEPAAAEMVVAYTPTHAKQHLASLLGLRRRLISQGPGGDLGSRLAYVFDRLLDGKRAVLVVGSDCPALSGARIAEAAEALVSADVVVGPSEDGGYYLIGMRRPHPELFQGVPWSTGDVLEATRERIEKSELTSAWLPVERDIDTPIDLFELLAGASAARLKELYPRTSAVLHSTLPPRRLSALEERILGRDTKA